MARQDRALPWRQGGYQLGAQVMHEGVLYYLAIKGLNSVNLENELEQGFWAQVSGGTPGATVASGVSYTPTAPLVGTDVQAALDELAVANAGMATPINSYILNADYAVPVVTLTLAPNVFRAGSFQVRRTITINELRINVTTPGSSGSRAWVALYANTLFGGADAPGPLIATTGEQLSDAGGLKIVSITPAVLAPGLYWVGYNCNEVGTEPTMRALSQSALGSLGVTSALGTNAQCSILSIGITYSATAPNPAPTGMSLLANSSVPILAMRRSA